MKIKSKITITFVSIFLIVSTLIFTANIYFNDKSFTQEIKNDLTNISQLKIAKVITHINNQKQTATLLAASQVFRDFLQDNNQSKTYQYNKNRAQKRLNRSLPVNVNYDEIFLIDKNGKVVLSTDQSQEGVDKSTDDYFLNGQKATFLKSVYLSSTSKRLSYAIGSPLLDDTTKELLGVLVIRINVEDLYSQTADQTGLGKTGESFLINKDLYLITPSRYLNASSVLKTKIDTQNARECMAQIGQNMAKNYIDYRGVQIVGTHSYIPEMGWCLITKIDRNEIYQPIISSAIITIILAVIGAIIFIIVSLMLSIRISKPIEELTDNVKEITDKGNWGIKIISKSKDEVGDLSRSFSKMVESVESSRREIEIKVAAQTKEIIEKGKNLEDQQKAILNILDDIEVEKNKAEVEKTRYEALLTGIADGVIATDNENKIIVINNVAQKILGLDKTEVYGKKLVDAFTVVDQKGIPIPENLRPINLAISTMQPFFTSTASDYYYQKKDGTKIPVALSASPVVVNGKLMGVIDVFRDITHEKDVDRMKTEFISLSSHQLRTPLSAIKWFGEMLLAGDAGPLSKEQKEFVDNIAQSTERMIALVNSLLNISRIESGRIIIDPTPTHLPDLVNGVIEEVRNKLDEKKQNLITSFNPNLPAINIDPKLIREVYKNLLTNSIKYTPVGGEISIFISKNEKEIISQITDNGYGIPQKDQEKIYDKFFRGENIVKLETEGTGLGLYLVKAVIESSGGKIWFKSQENSGTTFWFALPLTGSMAKNGEVTINS